MTGELNMRLISLFLFPMAMIAFILIMTCAGLYKFKGTRLKTRMIYGLALSILFSLFFLCQSGGDIAIIGNGLFLGVILAPLSILYTRRWIEKRLDNGTVYYHRNHRARYWLWFIPFFICLQFLFHSEFGKQLLNAAWPVLGLCFSWVILQVYTLSYIIKLENKLGQPIMEDKK